MEHTSPVLPPDQRPDWDSLLPMPASRVSSRKPLVIGHRGAQGLAPENTLAGFEIAAGLGVDGIEFDVQRSRDGHLVVFHDVEIDRVTDGSGNLYELTLDEIKGLDAGSAFDARFRGERVPTLEEAFAYFAKTDLLLFIELKDPWRFEGIEAEVIELIRRYGLVEQSQVRSFFHAALHTTYHLAPEIAISELWFDRLPQDDEITYKTVNALHLLYTSEEIARLHARGVQVTAWTVNDVADARRLIAAGIDGITTNYPDRMLPLIDSPNDKVSGR
jgi:glycerophosphoryl diester phosphodiesterase